MKERVHVLGVPVDRVTMDTARRYVDAMLQGEVAAGAVFAVNPEKIVKCRGDERLRSVLEQAALLVPDGIGVVWASRVLGYGHMQRVAGCDLMPVICEQAQARGRSVALIGARPEINARAREVLLARFPRLKIAGGCHGFPGEGGIDTVEHLLRTQTPDAVFVALGSPRQEFWIEEWRQRFPAVRLWQGVGGSFDVLAGEVKRAPVIWQRLNLEWAYRLLSDPRRAIRQVSLLRFAWWVIKARAGRAAS